MDSFDPTSSVYALSQLWSIDTGLIKVLNVASLVDLGGQFDEEIAPMIYQVYFEI
jgi:hypothetical protein